MCVWLFLTALFKIAKIETTQMTINKELINKFWYIHAVEYYAAIKRGAECALCAIRGELSDTLSEEKQTVNITCYLWVKMEEKLYLSFLVWTPSLEQYIRNQ